MKKQYHFRFPVFEDDKGAKLEGETTTPSKPAPAISAPYIERKKLEINQPEKGSSELFLGKDIPQMDQKAEDDLVKERLQQSTDWISLEDEQVLDTPFVRKKRPVKEEKKEVQPSKETLPEKRKHYDKSDYRSFANEPELIEQINEDGTTADVDRIPQVKRKMQQSRESMQAAVPFRRKQKKRHKKS